MDDMMTDIFSVQSDTNTINSVETENKNQNIDFLPIDQLVTEKTEEVKIRKKDKILIIQLTLLVIWVILTALLYFFGYDLFEPFIKV